MVNCPMCDTAIDVEEDELDEGDVLTCEECGATLNVVSVDPLELESDDEEDDEEDGYDGYDEDEDEDEEEEEDEDWK